jgi:transposase
LQRRYTALLTKLRELGLLKTTKTKRKLSWAEQSVRYAAHQRRVARYDEIQTLSGQGHSVLQIAKQLRMSRMTVTKYLALSHPPAAIEHRRVRQILDPYLNHLQSRWEQGCHNAKALWRELQELGFKGSYKPIQRWAALQRTQPGRLLSSREQNRLKTYSELELSTSQLEPTSVEMTNVNQETKQAKLLEALAPRHLAWVFLKQSQNLSSNERKWLTYMSEQADLENLYQLSQMFASMVREHSASSLEAWLEKCRQNEFNEVVNFGEGVLREYGAIEAGLTLKWSNEMAAYCTSCA